MPVTLHPVRVSYLFVKVWQLLSTAKSPVNELLRWVRAFIGVTRFDAGVCTVSRGEDIHRVPSEVRV